MRVEMLMIVVAGLAGMLGAAELKVEKLGEAIWRVRLKRDGAASWPESGMNRYGVFAELPVEETSASLDSLRIKPEVKHVGAGFEIKFPLKKDTRVFGLGDVSRDNIQRRPGTYEIYVKNVYSYIPMPVAFTTEGGVLSWSLRRMPGWSSSTCSVSRRGSRPSPRASHASTSPLRALQRLHGE